MKGASNGYFTCERCGKVIDEYHIVHIQDTEEYVCDDPLKEKLNQECIGVQVINDSVMFI